MKLQTDSDGCHDFEDIDDDNDLIPDIDDNCASDIGWIATLKMITIQMDVRIQQKIMMTIMMESRTIPILP